MVPSWTLWSNVPRVSCPTQQHLPVDQEKGVMESAYANAKRCPNPTYVQIQYVSAALNPGFPDPRLCKIANVVLVHFGPHVSSMVPMVFSPFCKAKLFKLANPLWEAWSLDVLQKFCVQLKESTV